MKTVATENIASASGGPSLPSLIVPTRPERPRLRESVKDPTDASLASTRIETWSGALANKGETRANSSLSLRGFSTMPTTARRTPSSARIDPSSSRSSLATPSVTATSPRPYRVPALAEREELAAVRAVRILRPEVHLVHAAGDDDGAVADDVRGSEPSLGGGDCGIELPRVGAVDLQHGVGRAELRLDGACVVDESDAADRGRDSDGEERHDE